MQKMITSHAISTQPINDLVQKNACYFFAQLEPIVLQLIGEMGLPLEIHPEAKSMLIAEAIFFPSTGQAACF